MLPTELVDHVFSFLRGDTAALEACLQAHPAHTRLAERHLYVDIVIQSNTGLSPAATHRFSEIYERFSTNPHLLYYPRTLELHGCIAGSNASLPATSFFAMAPRMANLVTLKLSRLVCPPRPTGECDHFLSTFRDCLSQLSIEELHLSNFYDIPLSVLDNGTHIKKLTLFECIPMDEPMSYPGPEESLESLVISGDHNPGLLLWAMHRVSRLTSLELRRMPGDHDWSVFPDLLTACSSSLRTLYLDVGIHCWSTYFYPDLLSQGRWFNEDLEFPFTFSACKSLKDVFIQSLISDLLSESAEFALPAIIRLLKTAPSIQSVILSFECEIPEAKFLSQLDWSLLDRLQGVCHRIELRISGSDYRGRLFTPQAILDALAGNEVLMDLVQRNVVILNPGINDY